MEEETKKAIEEFLDEKLKKDLKFDLVKKSNKSDELIHDKLFKFMFTFEQVSTIMFALNFLRIQLKQYNKEYDKAENWMNIHDSIEKDTHVSIIEGYIKEKMLMDLKEDL